MTSISDKLLGILFLLTPVLLEKFMHGLLEGVLMLLLFFNKRKVLPKVVEVRTVLYKNVGTINIVLVLVIEFVQR